MNGEEVTELTSMDLLCKRMSHNL